MVKYVSLLFVLALALVATPVEAAGTTHNIKLNAGDVYGIHNYVILMFKGEELNAEDSSGRMNIYTELRSASGTYYYQVGVEAEPSNTDACWSPYIDVNLPGGSSRTEYDEFCINPGSMVRTFLMQVYYTPSTVVTRWTDQETGDYTEVSWSKITGPLDGNIGFYSNTNVQIPNIGGIHAMNTVYTQSGVSSSWDEVTSVTVDTCQNHNSSEQWITGFAQSRVDASEPFPQHVFYYYGIANVSQGSCAWISDA